MWYFFTSSYMQLQNNKIPFRQNNKTTKKTRNLAAGLSYKKQELPTLCEHLCSPPVFGFWFLVSVLCVFVLFYLNPVSMLPVSLDCPFLIVPSVFCNLRPMPCVPNVVSISGLSILDCPFSFL